MVRSGYLMVDKDHPSIFSLMVDILRNTNIANIQLINGD